MALHDSAFVACFPIQEQLVDKDTGLPLADGSVGFYSDSAFTVLKAVYQQSQQSPYGFSELVNPVTLTSIGTFGDDNGTDIIPFLFPYTSTPEDTALGDVEPYFIKVLSSEGVEQFTRSQWPPNLFEASNVVDAFNGTENQIANPQFVEVLFTVDPSTAAYAYTVASGTTTIQVAQDWYIEVVASGAGTVTLKQVALSDTTAPGAAPYALDLNSSGLISSLKLYQRLVHSPRLLTGGYVNGYLSVASVSPSTVASIALSYVPSGGDSYTFATTSTIADNQFVAITGTVLIDADEGTLNPDTATAGYVDFVIDIAALQHVQITNAQMMSVEDADETATFIQQSTSRQIDHLFHYYKPQLEDKPIPSYTIGWDFPFNPCQEFGTIVTTANMNLGGVNKSRYIADQTIAFQAVDDALSFAFSTSAGLTAAAAIETQWALVQYLDAASARELLKGKMAIRLKGNTTGAALTGYVNIYWNANATLPTVSPNTFNSLIGTMSSGQPLTFNGPGTWVKVQRSGLGDAVFSLPLTTAAEFEFSGWSGLDAGFAGTTPITGGTTASYIAIVVSFTSMPITTGVVLEYVSLMAGDIATRPAPLSKAQTLQSLQCYYQCSFPFGTPAGANAGGGIYGLMVGTGIGQRGPFYTYPTPLRIAATPLLFNPSVAASNEIYNITSSLSWTSSGVDYHTAIGFATSGTTAGAANSLIAVNFIVDARLGVI